MRLGIFDHFGWAVAVVADDDHRVVDRRRIELVERDVTPAPIHYERQRLDAVANAALVEEVRASVRRATSASFDDLAAAVDGPIVSLSLRSWPADFPTDITVLREPPWEARADAVMYRQVAAEVAAARGWAVVAFEANGIEDCAAAVLGDRADDVLRGPRKALGPPWAKDHRVALAATVLAAPSKDLPAPHPGLA